MIIRKKSGFIIVEQAIMLVPEFEKVVRKLEQQVVCIQIGMYFLILYY